MIILTSDASQVVNQLNEYLPTNALRVAFITTASNCYSDKLWVDADRQALKRIGREVIPIDIAITQGQALAEQLRSSDIIFVCGGNAFLLLQESHRSGFSEILASLLADGKHYIGSSAGSVLLGPSLTPFRDLDDPSEAPGLSSDKGLGLVPFVPLVHFGNKKYATKYASAFELAFRESQDIISIRDNQLLICSEGSVRWG